MNVHEALYAIQAELKAPKGNFNSFGKYKYRSCEDILEAVKPLLKKYDSTLTLSDDVVQLGDRYYIKATASLQVVGEANFVQNTAWARESAEKKGQDDSQITGTASSYARKYALNGLFLIDDTKDADTDEYHKQTTSKKETTEPYPERGEMIKVIKKKYDKERMEKLLGFYNVEKIEDLPDAQLKVAFNKA